MTDVHDLLEQDGRQWRDGFQPPDLDVVLGEVIRSGRSRARWVWPIVAAVLLLTVPLITLLLRSNPRHDQPAVKPPASKLLGSVPWTGVAVSQGHDGRSVSVWVDIDKSNWCLDAGLPVLQASAVEKPDKITIQVRAYVPAGYQPPTAAPGTVLGCSLVGYAPIPLLVHLSAPMGRRSLVDATTGQSHPVRQAADMPSLTKLPAGYVDAGSTPPLGQPVAETVEQFGILPFAASRTYRNGNNLLILVRYQKKPLVPFAQGPVVATGTVLGHPAQVIASTEVPCVGWAGDGYTWQLCASVFQSDVPYISLGVAGILAIANSLR